MIMQKIILTEPSSYIDGSQRQPGEHGVLVMKQDDLGSRIVNLIDNNINEGAVFTFNRLPRAVNVVRWTRTDTKCYWELVSEDIGIYPTLKPVFIVDDYNDTLEILHDLYIGEVLISIDNGEWEPYTGVMDVGPVDRPEGYYRAYIPATENRTASPIAYSLPFHSQNVGFDYTLEFELE